MLTGVVVSGILKLLLFFNVFGGIMINERIHRQLSFIKEIDKLKKIFRQTYLLDESRKENDAEHSWHLAVMAMVLHEYGEGDINLLRVMKMVLLHDIVEIDAGDTYCYDDRGRETQEERENAAADRIFALLDWAQSEHAAPGDALARALDVLGGAASA